MKKRFLILVMILSLALTFNPQPAQAAITWDFAAITSAIKNAILAGKRQVILVKENVSQWKIVQNLGNVINSVSAFYQSVKKEYQKKKDQYSKYLNDIQNFWADANAFYYAALETYHAALDAAEYITETANRYKMYLEEGRDIIRSAKETLQYCKDAVTNVFDMAKEAKEQLDEQKRQKAEAEAEVERLKAEIAELESRQCDPFEDSRASETRDDSDVRPSARPSLQSLGGSRAQDDNLNRIGISSANGNGNEAPLAAGLGDEIPTQTPCGLSDEELQRLREVQDQLERYQQWLAEAGTSQQYANELGRVNSEINRLMNLKNEILAQLASPEPAGFIRKDEITGETTSGPIEMISPEDALDEINKRIRELEVEARVYEEKLRFVSNREYYENEIARLEEERDNLGHHNESNQVTNWIRDRRDRLEIYMAKIDTFNRYIANINRQIDNFITTQKNMIYQCKYNIAMVKARSERLVCNMTIGELEGFDNEVQNLGANLANWNDQLVNLGDDLQEFGNDFKGCEYLRTDCEYGMTDKFGTWNWDWEFFKSAEINDVATEDACNSYYVRCVEPNEHVCDDPNPDNCARGLINVKVEPMQGGASECERFVDEILSSTEYDNIHPIFNYSVSYSEPIASAFINMGNITGEEGGTDENGVFLLPIGLAKCCELEASSAKGEDIQKCMSRFNKVRAGSSDQKISNDDKYFFQCLRKEINNPEFDDKTRASDATYAGQYMLEGYAEYMAASYFEAMGIYNESFTYKEDQIDPVASNKTKDVKSAWVAIVEMNRQIAHRINEINRLWSREQSARAYLNSASYGITDDKE